jgi:hypothetical protein
MPWLRQEFSPRLVLLLKELNVRWVDGLDEADTSWFFEKTRLMRIDLTEKVVDEVSPIATTFTQEQLGYASKHFSKKNEKWSDLLQLSDDELAHKRSQKLNDTAESWYGDLTELQRESLCEIFGCRRADITSFLEYSLDWQGELLALLRDTTEPKQFAGMVRAWARDPVRMIPPLRRNSWLANQNQSAKRLARFDLKMTESQRTKAIKKLQKYSEDLNSFVIQAD